MIQFIDQTHRDLRYALFEGDPDLTALHILCEAGISLPDGYHLRAGILGASHFVKLHLPSGHCISEVFACVETPVDTNCVKLHAASLEMLQGAQRAICGVRYEFQFSVHKLSEQLQLIGTWEEEIRTKHKSGIFLQYDFPPSQAGCYTPKTLVIAEYNEDEQIIRTRTVHEYPNEDIVVINKSTFTIKNNE